MSAEHEDNTKANVMNRRGFLDILSKTVIATAAFSLTPLSRATALGGPHGPAGNHPGPGNPIPPYNPYAPYCVHNPIAPYNPYAPYCAHNPIAPYAPYHVCNPVAPYPYV
jgi:hypothetical protein